MINYIFIFEYMIYLFCIQKCIINKLKNNFEFFKKINIIKNLLNIIQYYNSIYSIKLKQKDKIKAKR